ncbi:MAG: NADPH:quinone oxidoreductase family protein [Proteobacteria bacterium]|nr:NADPH:quinone oxidoreductase family protein [Pseudomonadota bacterium]
MLAARCYRFASPPEVEIDSLPSPVPGEGQVGVEVHYASVNFPDVLIAQNLYQVSAPLPFTPGSELAGVVSAVGPGAGEFALGDRVCGATFVGAFAEEVVLPAAGLRRLDPEADLAAASAFGVTYGTAYHALRSFARLEAGQTLVVLGAAGGVGLAAVEIGRELGARVIAAASSAERLELCRARGAAEGICYADEDLKQRIRELAPDGADAVLDPVGGEHAEAALRATRWRGRFVCVGFASGEIPRIPLNLVLLKGAEIVGLDMRAFSRFAPEEMERNQAELWALFDSGRLRPYVSTRYPLERAGEALAALGERRATGKVVVEMPRAARGG